MKIEMERTYGAVHFRISGWKINPCFLELQADQELRSYGPATELTGSTATVAMVRRGELVCANLGDSRAIASVRYRVQT